MFLKERERGEKGRMEGEGDEEKEGETEREGRGKMNNENERHYGGCPSFSLLLNVFHGNRLCIVILTARILSSTICKYSIVQLSPLRYAVLRTRHSTT
jgi:hypothetical protein